MAKPFNLLVVDPKSGWLRKKVQVPWKFLGGFLKEGKGGKRKRFQGSPKL